MNDLLRKGTGKHVHDAQKINFIGCQIEKIEATLSDKKDGVYMVMVIGLFALRVAATSDFMGGSHQGWQPPGIANAVWCRRYHQPPRRLNEGVSTARAFQKAAHTFGFVFRLGAGRLPASERGWFGRKANVSTRGLQTLCGAFFHKLCQRLRFAG